MSITNGWFNEPNKLATYNNSSTTGWTELISSPVYINGLGNCSNTVETIRIPGDEKALNLLRWTESNTFRKNRKETNEMPYRKYSECSRNPGIKKVIFNPPATIVFWYDNIKTVVKCGENDAFDPEKGLAMAIAKRYLQNKGNYYNTFKKWLPEETKHEEISEDSSLDNDLRSCTFCKYFDLPPVAEPCRNCYTVPSRPNFVKETE